MSEKIDFMGVGVDSDILNKMIDEKRFFSGKIGDLKTWHDYYLENKTMAQLTPEEKKELKDNEEILKKEYERIKNQKGEDEVRKKLGMCYDNLIRILKKYCDINKNYYSLVALWIIGTYMHENFKTYPYLFINAMKSSGKTRLLKLITHLSKEGSLLNSLTEAVLFRTRGTLGIDEFEGIGKKGINNLRELLNSAYKKGTTVKRMRKVTEKHGEKQVVEQFDVYRPIVIANIWGMEEVLGDRCINLILEKSNRSSITKLVEDFDEDSDIKTTLTTLTTLECSLCSVVTQKNVYQRWNNYIIQKHDTTSSTHSTYTTLTTLTTQKEEETFNKIDKAEIDGRNLELSLPLFIIAGFLNEEILDDTIKMVKELVVEKKSEEFIESMDVSFYDFVSQYPFDGFVSVAKLTSEFRAFLQTNDEDINSKWTGRALKRLGLIIKRVRKSRGVEVKLNIEKAQQKIRMFK